MRNQFRKGIYDDKEEDIRSKFFKSASKWAEREGYYQEAELLLKQLSNEE